MVGSDPQRRHGRPRVGLAESGGYWLRWGLGMDPTGTAEGKSAASKWFEYRTESLADKSGFRVKVWNRLSWTESTLSLGSRKLGQLLPPNNGPNQRPVLWLKFAEPAYRVPLTSEISAVESDRIRIRTTRAVQLRLH